MTDRYATPLDNVWSTLGRFHALLDAAPAAAYISGGDELREAVVKSVELCRDRCNDWIALEKQFDHDIAAFVELVRARVPDHLRDQWHLRRTSSDLVETAMAVQIGKSHEMLQTAMRELTRRLSVLAVRHATDPVMGKTHGQDAEPTSIGRKFALHAYWIHNSFFPAYSFAKLSGPVGTDGRAALGDEGLSYLHLDAVPSTQIVPRVALAKYVADLAAWSVALSTLATEIRLGARSGGWLHERSPSEAARGSSSMAQKRNPVRSERAVGLCKVIRHNCYAVIDAGSELWEERDISHSSVERTALVDALRYAWYVTFDLAGVVERLEVDRQFAEVRTRRPTGEGVLTEAVVAGRPREEAYRLIRSQGVAYAAERYGVRGWGRFYDPTEEPELWQLVRSLLD